MFLRALSGRDGDWDYCEALRAIDTRPNLKNTRAIYRYLKDWGALGRNLPRCPDDGEKPLTHPQRKAWEAWNRELVGWLSRGDVKHALRSLRTRAHRLESVQNWKVVGDRVTFLFDSLKRTMGKGFGVAAVGKTLHILLPDLCVVWDNKWVLDRQRPGGDWYDQDGAGYVCYLKNRQQILKRLRKDLRSRYGLKTDQEALRWLWDHRNDYCPSQKPRITKLLDEINYYDDEDEEIRSLLLTPANGREADE